MSEVSVKGTIHGSADAVWQTISDFNESPRFVETVTTSTMEGRGVGALRTLTLNDGARIVERLEKLNGTGRSLSYSIVEAPLPLRDYLATMTVRELDGGGCELEWSSTFVPDGATEAEVQTLIRGIYEMGLEGLNRLHGS